MPTAERVLLDTHVLLWWKADRRRLSAAARRQLDDAAEVLVSPMTFWEIAMLVDKQRIALDRPTATWSHDLLAEDRMALAPVSPDIAIAAGELNPFQGDPVDRILTATAVEIGVPLLTKDARIRSHAKSSALRTVW
jgi:PIN domain nuclease of toxin-antitoxin system